MNNEHVSVGVWFTSLVVLVFRPFFEHFVITMNIRNGCIKIASIQLSPEDFKTDCENWHGLTHTKDLHVSIATSLDQSFS